ncbi:hypothetical protein [Rivibacter subsaxonicus]|uniref:Nucleotidyltransferase-like protein n=1 Tax=Rivibacter subsaxonicus TaxID=457575 RepID=A0A4Q7VGD4_9BURK|nr:hypothetical protein [Rivibacter subsaxonicus]RZT95079.1 hypothetical protein EV670_2827 [Rivibacter subsaxonicus]
MKRATAEIAATAARLVVEEGLEYGPAKRRAARMLQQRGGPAPLLPDNDAVEDEVRDYLALFCADTHPAELRALRELALVWMERLAEFRPHLGGAVWRGTATRRNDIHLELYCDDSKSAEIALINAGADYEVQSANGPRGEAIDVLSLSSPCPALGEEIGVHLRILDHDDLRGGLKVDARGRTERGDAEALRRRLAEPDIESESPKP